MALAGKDDLCYILRALTSAELYLNSSYYASHPYFVSNLAVGDSSTLLECFFTHSVSHDVSDILPLSRLSSNVSRHEAKSMTIHDRILDYSQCSKLEAFKNCQDKRWSPFVCLMALSSVLGLPVKSYYPDCAKESYAFRLMNTTIQPRIGTDDLKEPVHLLWTIAGGIKEDLNPRFSPNHVVPLFFLTKNVLHAPSSCVKSCTKKSIAGLFKATSKKEQQSKIYFPKVSNITQSSECKDKLLVTSSYNEELLMASNVLDRTQISTDELNLRDIGNLYFKVNYDRSGKV